MSALHNTDNAARAAAIERALLGSVMTVGLIPKLPPRPEDFVSYPNGLIWRAVLSVAARGDSPNMILVAHELDSTEMMERAGGAAYVSMMLDSCDCSEIATYARLVREEALIRKSEKRRSVPR